MAAAYAALVSIMSNMEQIMSHPRLSNSFDNEQIQSLLEKAGFLLSIIEGNKYGGGSTEAEDMERQITSAAHAAEDVIESHIVDQILAGSSRESAGVRNMVRDWEKRIATAAAAAHTTPPVVCQIHVHSLDLQQLIQDMDAVVEKAMKVEERGGGSREDEQQPLIHSRHLVGSGESAMVGFDDELNQLLDELTNNHSNRHVISIVGMGGTGKTTLARNLLANLFVVDHFDIRAFATVSQQYKVGEILSQLLSCLGKSTKGDVGELGGLLHKTLYGKRYLIVLDDIWGVEAWDRVRRYLPDGGNSSRVVLTTRLSSVAGDCGSTCIDVNLLDEGKGWKLFCEKSLFPNKDDPLQLEDVAKEIVKSCKGLALSIVLIGGLLLNSPRTVGCWVNVLRGLKTNDSKEKQQGLDALSLSYNQLPPHLKPCFLYLGVFKEDSSIRVSNITRLWVAEGFIKPKGTQVLEEIAEDYLKDLSDRNLILGLERKFSGKIKSFSIHDLLRDLCIKVAEQQEFFHVMRFNKSLDGTVRRLVCEPFANEGGASLARSIFGWNYSFENVKHKLLRVFDVSGNENPEDVYGNNVNLRYLVHERLSANVCLLWNLQTLIIKGDCESPLVVVPLGIWKMRQLRHVKCNQVYLPDPPPRRYGRDQMEQLQTLRTALNMRLSEEMCEIIPNIKKLSLLYDAKVHGYDDSLIECLHNLDRFHKLESLSMKIMTSKWPRPNPELSSQLALPGSLKKLWLESCELCWEDMSVIGSLPQLQVLRLKFHAIMETGLWSPVGGQFLRLKLLEIKSCRLYSWDADSSHFPVLEKLLLRDVCFLKEIPPEIGEIPTLGLIRVEYCGESAAISAVKIKKDQLENYGNDALRIEVVFSDSDVKSFEKRVEAEELDLSLFKLETY